MVFSTPVKSCKTLLEFRFKGSVIRATTDRTRAYWGGDAFDSEPSISVKLPERSGGLDREVCEVILPTNRPTHPGIRALARALSDARAVPPCSLKVMSVEETTDGQTESSVYFSGDVEKVFRNPESTLDKVKLEFTSPLISYISEQTLGLRADPTCSNIYGDTGCFVSRRLLTASDSSDIYPAAGHANSVHHLKVTTTFQSYHNRTVAVSVHVASMPFVTHPIEQVSKKSPDFWVGSYLEKDGLRLGIQEWKADTNVFTLNQVPPLDWDGAVVTLAVDCPRTQKACQQRQGALAAERFNGYGAAIPAYNPVMDIGRT